MVYTVTFNPSLDYIVSVDNFETGMTNRTSSELVLPGGKGINVSIVLNNMKIDTTALGFVAGFTGREIASRVEAFGVRTEFINIDKGMSRINLKIKNIDGTEINGMGPDISPEMVEKLINRLDMLQENDVLVLAGSIPKSISDRIYSDICGRLSDKKISVAVDATSDLLLKVLEYNPFLIKPNHHELGEIFNVTLTERHEVVEYAKRLRELGARNVIVSMGGKGAVFLAENGEIFEAEAPEGELKNSVGAGDSMVAGFIAGWSRYHSYKEAFAMGVACGSASAFSENLATETEVLNVLKKVAITKIGGTI